MHLGEQATVITAFRAFFSFLISFKIMKSGVLCSNLASNRSTFAEVDVDRNVLVGDMWVQVYYLLGNERFGDKFPVNNSHLHNSQQTKTSDPVVRQ